MRALGLILLLAFAAPVLAASVSPPKDGAGVLVSGAAGLPDLARGEQAAAAGRTADAERDLVPLAERGYVAAQFALAKLYGRMETPEATTKAIRWYRVVLPTMPMVQVPLARLLLREPATPAAQAEAEGLLRKAWMQREDIEALAGLIRLYSETPALDTGHRLAGYAAKAEKLDRAETNLALIHWYRATPLIEGHPPRLLVLCRKALDLAPECYVDLVRAARTGGDRAQLRTLSSAVLSQLGAGRINAELAATFVRSLLADAEGAITELAAPPVTDLPEDDNPAIVGAPSTAPGVQSCTQAAVGTGSAAAAAPPAPSSETAAHDAAPTAAVPGVTLATKLASTPAAASTAEPELAEPILRRLLQGSPEARVLAAGIIVRFAYLAPDVEPEAILEAGRKQGVAEAPLYLGELYLAGQRAPRNPSAAREQLEAAAKVPVTSAVAQFFLGRLYQAGYLDEVDPAAARDHLLLAARAGYVAADSALARLYASGKGICPNHRYAWVFARLGAQGGALPIRQLLGDLQQAMSADELKAADALLKQELAARAGLLSTVVGTAPRHDDTRQANAGDIQTSGVSP